MTNGELEVSSVNLSFSFSWGTDFLLLSTHYDGIYGVLFDDGQKDVPLDVSFNALYSFYFPFSC